MALPPHELESYAFDLPERLIAQAPAEPRDASRLLVLDRAAGSWSHRRFTDLPELLDARDLLVANNTRVLRARLLGQRLRAEPDGREIEGGRVEFVLLEERAPLRWEGLFHASARYVPGLRFLIPTPDGQGLRGTLVRGSADSPFGTVEAEFDRDPVASGAGELPLPHYIARATSFRGSAPRSGDARDEENYQTVYAKALGSAAAPTAGLHFTPRVLEALRGRGVGWGELTLHVGLGTFRPVKDADIRQHQMHEERYEVSAALAARVTAHRRGGGRVVAVGTTSARTLESAWGQPEGALTAGPGRTRIFIHPGGREFAMVDRMITNFHLPRSSLLMMVCAFAGRELVLNAYADAIREGYRFYSFGDAMLIL